MQYVLDQGTRISLTVSQPTDSANYIASLERLSLQYWSLEGRYPHQLAGSSRINSNPD